jgi:hypothetical protein
LRTDFFRGDPGRGDRLPSPRGDSAKLLASPTVKLLSITGDFGPFELSSVFAESAKLLNSPMLMVPGEDTGSGEEVRAAASSSSSNFFADMANSLSSPMLIFPGEVGSSTSAAGKSLEDGDFLTTSSSRISFADGRLGRIVPWLLVRFGRLLVAETSSS